MILFNVLLTFYISIHIYIYILCIYFVTRHVTQLSTNQVVTQTSKDIARLTVLMRRGDKQQKLQIEKLTTDFKDALQRYSDMQKVKYILLIVSYLIIMLSCTYNFFVMEFVVNC